MSPDRSVRRKAERQAINSPGAVTLADMMEWAIALIDAELPERGGPDRRQRPRRDLSPISTRTRSSRSLPQVMEIMSNLPFHEVGWNPPLKFTVDAEVGQNLAEVKKWKPGLKKAA